MINNLEIWQLYLYLMYFVQPNSIISHMQENTKLHPQELSITLQNWTKQLTEHDKNITKQLTQHHIAQYIEHIY